MDNDIEYSTLLPAPSIASFVESFWMLKNHSSQPKDIVVLPDGRVDLSFSSSATDAFNIRLMGLGSKPDITSLAPRMVIFAVSFHLPAMEYIFGTSIAAILDGTQDLGSNYWGIDINDLNNLDQFCVKVSAKINALVPADIDSRKRRLFELIYSSHGTLTVQALSDQVFWSSRQINRYFNSWFGISLKAYCSILRFKASLPQIATGQLFPEQDFADQAHFIKEIKRLSGATPRDLFKNKNDRFIQFSAIQGR